MDYLTKLYLKLRYDDRGASMVEYTVLTGLITVAVIAGVVFVGGWVGDQWLALETALTPVD